MEGREIKDQIYYLWIILGFIAATHKDLMGNIYSKIIFISIFFSRVIYLT